MTRHSLHIGIDRYDDNHIHDLPFCVADAELLASFFRSVGAICEEHGMASLPCVNLMRVRGGNERLW